jgi:hypothetical protein
VSVVIYVCDTSYLIELVNCGRDADAKASPRVRELFAEAARAGARFVVPLPCLFELGDHIADVGHAARRQELADLLTNTVATSLETERPWIITPTAHPKAILPELLQIFRGQGVKKQIGLVDLFAASEAHRLKTDYSDRKAKVHIWTNDRALKGQEPDQEANPFHW